MRIELRVWVRCILVENLFHSCLNFVDLHGYGLQSWDQAAPRLMYYCITSVHAECLVCPCIVLKTATFKRTLRQVTQSLAFVIQLMLYILYGYRYIYIENDTNFFMEGKGYVYDLCALYRALPVVLRKKMIS